MRHIFRLNGLIVGAAMLLSLTAPLQAAEVSGKAQMTAPAFVYSVDKAISEWEASTAVPVSPKAKGSIAAQLSGYLNKGGGDDAAPYLTKAYLYELRDFKAQTGTSEKMLDLVDVNRFPMNRLVTSATYDKGVGFLKCSSSDLKGGKITIDGEAKGTTVKEFVLATGRHTVVIATERQRCEEAVMIQDQQQAESSCPKQK